VNEPQTPEINTVAVVGAGVIGASWSALFMANGLDVIASDPAEGTEEALAGFVDNALKDLRTLGYEGEGKLTFVANSSDAVSGADFVQENGPEREAIKVELLAALDEAAPPHAIIASSTSALLRSKITAKCKTPERVIVGHPFNPPHLVPLVEIVGASPDCDAVKRAEAFYQSLDRETVIMKKEAVGHLINRINSAVWREAVSLYQQGLADPADIDRAITAGPGMRWPFLGPYEMYHLGGGEGGIAHYFDHLQPIQEERWKDMPTPELDDAFRQKVVEAVQEMTSGHSIEELAKRRDRRLLALLSVRDKLKS
jgi:3-hydroxyacyl-CoA dehydrogenase